MKICISTIAGLFFILLASFTFNSPIEKASMRMTTQTWSQGKLITMSADIYYHTLSGKMITVYPGKDERIIITNNKGEVAVYNPKRNEVTTMQNAAYSTESNFLYYFLNGNILDLGLRAMKFQLMETTTDNGMVITSWFPPAELFNVFSKIEMVHEDFLPIYIAYYGKESKLVKKVYYSDYSNISEINIPLSITEFNYLPKGDSLISRIRIENLNVNQKANSPYFNFSIPKDAKRNE